MRPSSVANATDEHARLNLYVDEKGSVDLDMVSLFPRRHMEEPPERVAQGPGATAL